MKRGLGEKLYKTNVFKNTIRNRTQIQGIETVEWRQDSVTPKLVIKPLANGFLPETQLVPVRPQQSWEEKRRRR